MTSKERAQGQHFIECDLCKSPVSSFCRRCGIDLCDTCVTVHLQTKSNTEHDVVTYINKSYADSCAELIKTIIEENERLQTYKLELEKIIDHTTGQLGKQSAQQKLNFLSKLYQRKKDDGKRTEEELQRQINKQRLVTLSDIYQQRKNRVTLRGKEWHRLIDKTVTSLHQELDDMQKEHESLLYKQKRQLEKILENVDEINVTMMELKESQNLHEMRELISRIENQETPSETTQYSIPMFCEGKIDDSYMKSYFGYIDHIQERKIHLPRLMPEKAVVVDHKILEVPRVITAIYTMLPADKYGNRLCDIAVFDDNRVWLGGANKELKLFDLQGVLHDTVPITARGAYLTVHNKHVVYTDRGPNTVCRVADDKTTHTMLTTGEWIPFGITSTASDDLLVCLQKNHQSKVVRYSSTGTVLQEIQYDSQGRPLYGKSNFVTENANGDIIVTDWDKDAVIAVDRLGIFRFRYSGVGGAFDVCAVATDPAGHVIVTDFRGNKIHMLDRDGRFLRYIIPDQGINGPRSVCIIGDGEIFVGECLTGMTKRIKYLE